MLRRMVKLPVVIFLKEVVFRLIVVVLISLIVPSVVMVSMSDGFMRCSILAASSVITTSIAVLYAGCTSSERLMIMSKLKVVASHFKIPL